jgi:biopolymer transport protein ExbB
MMIMSLATWYILVMKLIDQRKLIASAKLAEQKFWTAGSLREAVDKMPKGDTYRSIAEDGLRAQSHLEGRSASDRVGLHDWVTMSLQRSLDAINFNLAGGMAVLATIGSTAPFVGLFGTVWGIYHALVAIGTSGQASIDKVAGPVGEARAPRTGAGGLDLAVEAVFGGETRWRQHGLAVSFLNAQHDVASTQVPEIIGKRTDRMHDSSGVPSLFEFEPLPFHGVSMEECWE